MADEDDDAPAKGRMGPKAYDTTERKLLRASVRTDLPSLHEDAPNPRPGGEPSLRRRTPGHESPDDAF